MANGYDIGDSNVFIVFQGKYLLTPVGGTFSTNTIMLGNTDIVLFQSDVTNLTDAGHVCNLPEQCRPKKDVQTYCSATTNKGRKIGVPLTIYSSGEVIFQDINSQEKKHANITIPAHETTLYFINDITLPVSVTGSTTISIPDGEGSKNVDVSITSTGTATFPKTLPCQIPEYRFETDIEFTDDGERVEVLHLNGFTFNICDRWYEGEEGASK